MVSAGLAIEMSTVKNTSSRFELCVRAPAALEGGTLGCRGELGREMRWGSSRGRRGRKR